MKQIYEGKAKKIFEIPGEPDVVMMEFKDSLTAFNALKLGSFQSKGILNRNIAALIFKYLAKKEIPSHFIECVGTNSMKTKRVSIIPLEVVVRNVLAGSTAKKFGFEEGTAFAKPLVEFYYKNDQLQDPFISDDQILAFGYATVEEIATLKAQALKINSAIQEMFHKIGIRLVDFKIEFGRSSNGTVLLADEITPDCCRLWDEKTNEKMDKDRFRRDLGDIDKYYNEVFDRLNTLAEKEGWS
jgi:phosphoribosylaminoimidazole-succinocarboxamide synthase